MTHEFSIGAIRGENEDDRSSEFKESRNILIKKVNDWLRQLAEKRDAGERLTDGSVILGRSRIQTISLGRSGPNTKAMLEERQAGISLTGDNISSPLILQAVRRSRPATTEVIEILGSDPLEISVNGNTFSSNRQSEVLADFGIRYIGTGPQEPAFRISVMGDGQVKRHSVDDNGVHISLPMRDVEELALAQMEFDKLSTKIN